MKKKFIISIVGACLISMISGVNIQAERKSEVELNVPILKEEEGYSLENYGERALTERSRLDIMKMYSKYPHGSSANIYQGKVYDEEPSVKSPYSSGRLSKEFLQDGLNTVNMVRYIAGFPADIMLKEEYNTYAQHGSVLMAVAGFSHYPPKPNDMTQDFYNKGSRGTSSSNISAGIYTLSESVLGCMEDDSIYNMEDVGHRRWLLSPYMKNIGFGFAESNNSTGFYGKYAATYVNDNQSKIPVDYIAWPAKGVMPVEYFGSKQPWSISIDLNTYKLPSLEEVKVKLRRVNDNKVWYFDKNNNAPSYDKKYFNVDNNFYCQPGCIIFKIPDDDKINIGDVFEVEVTGLKKLDNTATSIKYKTEFFEVSNIDWSKHWAEKEIVSAMDKKWINVSGEVRPNDSITRAEFIKITNNAFGLKAKASSEPFKDVKATDWWYNDVLKAIEAGYINTGNSNFRPAEPITREEVAVIISNIMKKKDKNLDKIKKYSDFKSISIWAQTSVEYMVESGYMGVNSTIFRPKSNITRAEAIVTLSRVVR